MSRRLGHLEQEILLVLTPRSGRSPILYTSEIARRIFGAGASNSQLTSLRRALGSLRCKKLIHEGPRQRGPRWENTWQGEAGLDLKRLGKLLNMLRGELQGERDAAVLAIERERKRLGGDWLQILRVRT
jgi:hypothetical protein